MGNLFSVFDSSGVFYGSNWGALALPQIFLFTQFWTMKNSYLLMISKALKHLLTEFTAIFSNVAFPGIAWLFTSYFMFIAWSNLLGLLPYVFTPTAHLLISMETALPLWLGMYSLAWYTQPSYMLAHLVPEGTPQALSPFMVLIEAMSSCIRPLTLAVRLAANLMAGHLLLALLTSGGTKASFTTVLVILVVFSLCVLETAVAVIQAYVFSILSSLYYEEVNSEKLIKP